MKNFIKKSIVILVIMIILMIGFTPFSIVKAGEFVDGWTRYIGDWVRIESSSEILLKKMAQQVQYGTFVGLTKGNYKDPMIGSDKAKNEIFISKDTSKNLYFFRLPDSYFNIYRPYSLMKNNYYNAPYNQKNRVKVFDFSNTNLGDISVLPDFYNWKCEASIIIKFNNCGITNLSAFKDKNNLEKIKSTEIELEGNKVTKKDYEEFEKAIKGYYIYIRKKPTIIDTTPSNDNKTDTSSNKSSSVTTKNTGALSNSNIDLNKVTGTATNYYTQKNNSDNKNTTSTQTTNSALLGISTAIGNNKATTNTNNNKTTTSIGNKTITTNTVTTTTVTTTYGADVDSSVEVNQSTYSKSKKIIIHVKMSGDKEPYVAAVPSDCYVYLNGSDKSIGRVNNNGTFTYEVKKNGTYNFEVRPYYFGEGNKHTVKITTIDTTKPSVKLTTSASKSIQEGGVYGINLDIAAEDDKQLKAIYVNGKNIANVKGTKATKSYLVNKSGNYTVKVEDQAGNIYELTKAIKIDTSKPEIINIKILKNGKEDGKTGAVKAKVGDTISFTLSANKTLKGYGSVIGNTAKAGGVFISVNGYGYKMSTKNTFINLNSNIIKFDIKVTKDLIENISGKDKFSGYAKITVHGITDLTNNRIDYTIKNRLYIDNVAPTVEKVNMNFLDQSQTRQTLFIENGKFVSIEMYMSEELSKAPVVEVGSKVYTSTYCGTNIVGSKTLFKYKVTVKCTDVLKLNKASKNSVVPVKIRDYIDKSGNKGKIYTIDSKNRSTNLTYLYYRYGW